MARPSIGVAPAADGEALVTIDGDPIGPALAPMSAHVVATWLRRGGFQFIQAVAARMLVAEITADASQTDSGGNGTAMAQP